MATLAPTSPDPQPDGHSLPRKLATAPEWQTFATVQPLFAADILWKVVDPERCNGVAAGDAKFEIDTMVKRFRIDMGLLLNGLPEDDISRHAFELCVKELRRLLQFLESLVLEKVNSAEKLGEAVDIEERTEIEDKDDRLCSTQSPSWARLVWEWLGYGQADQPPVPKFPEACGSTQPNRRSTSNPSETAPSNSPYKRLEALGKTIASSSNHGDLLLKECIDFLKLDHTFGHFSAGASIASRLSKRLDGLSKTTRRFSIQAQTVPQTNWSSEKSWTMLRQLFLLLLETTCRQHEARLRLNGFRLDDCSSSSPPIDMFISSCPTSTYWQDCRCTPIQSTPMTSGDQDGRVPLSDVCEYIGDSTAILPKRLLNVEFEEGVLLYRPTDHQFSTHAGQSSMVSFEELVDHQCFQPGGMFDVNDKAVLALSLGRCLVHLVQGPWLRRPWTGKDIQFLGRHDDVRDAWHPYVICPVAGDTANKDFDPADFDPADLVPLLLSFARLLVELETGERVLADPALPTFEDDIVAIQEDNIDGRGREDYIRAIEGCFKVKAALHQSIKRERDPTVHQRLRYLVRKTIYDGIVSHLERNFNQIARRDRAVILREVNQGKPALRFGIALAAETYPSETPVETQLSNLSVPVARATVADVDSERSDANQDVYPMFFDGESTTGSSSHAKYTEAFFSSFDKFREQYIVPKFKEGRAGRKRIRIAVLDTGIDRDEMRACLDVVAATREQHKCPKKDRDPIKETRSFTGVRGDNEEDNCGHGTHVTSIILRLAPEADLYIAKVASGTRFDNPAGIAKAIDWAVGVCDVDIINMSFGSPIIQPSIEDAIGRARERKPHEAILFAAASNSGLNVPRTYPASDTRVIGVHALDGHGYNNGWQNPSAIGKHDNFGTLGLGIRMIWKNQIVYKSGSSFASPTAAAIAANVLAWLDCMKDSLDGQHRFLRRTDGMRHIFELQGTFHDGLLSVAPCTLFKDFTLLDQKMPAAEDQEMPAAEDQDRRDREVCAVIKHRLQPVKSSG
ncbi:hypothetical protein RB600_001482 [Gaeumannomyces tritici]